MKSITKNLQYYKFCLYGFFKNLRFFDAFLILFFLEKHLNYVEIGLLYSVRELGIMMMEIPSGLIADALGRRRTLIASFLFYILSFLMFYFSESLVLLFSAMILFAIGDAFRTGVHKAMIFQYLKANEWSSQRVNYYGHTRSWSQMGSAFSALLAGVIVFYTGVIQQVFLWSVIPYLFNVVLIATYPTWLDGEKSRGQLHQITQRFAEVWKAFVDSVKQRSTLTALISTSLFSGYYSAIKDYVQPMIKTMALAIPVALYLNDDQRTALLVGVVYFVIFLLTAIASILSVRMASLSAHPYKPMNLTMTLGFAVGIVGFSCYYFNLYSLPILAFLIIMMIENMRKPLGIALVAELSEDLAMASVLSVTSQAKSLIAAIVAALTGWAADSWGLSTALIIVSSGLLLLYPFYRMVKPSKADR